MFPKRGLGRKIDVGELQPGNSGHRVVATRTQNSVLGLCAVAGYPKDLHQRSKFE